MIEDWKVKESVIINNCKIFSTRKDTSIDPKTGGEHEFYIVESPDWVNVVPKTEDGKFIIIKQFRHGIRKATFEIPGGMVDEGETPIESAKRELLEETGYVSDQWKQIGMVHPNPAIMNNSCFTFLAENVKKVENPKFEGTEDIETLIYPIEKIKDDIMNGQISHSLVINAFHFYLES